MLHNARGLQGEVAEIDSMASLLDEAVVPKSVIWLDLRVVVGHHPACIVKEAKNV